MSEDQGGVVSQQVDRKGVHATHCCKECGCKYGDPACPVVLGVIDAAYGCSECADTLAQLIEQIRQSPAARRRTIMNALAEDGGFCANCEFCKVIADPDPTDDFNDDDRAVVCLKERNREVKPNSKYLADRNPHRVVEGSVRPYQVGKVPTPEWCPLKRSL